MRYFDTSFLVPLIVPEASSAKVEAKLMRIEPGTLCISHWTRVEFASMIAREVRMGGLHEDAADAALVQFDELVEASFHVWLPEAADYELARLYIRNFASKLRAGDALHLAIARNRGARIFHTLDKTLLHAAKLLRIKASAL
ncbi:MAG: type II toxin-antitoxin system VapC family toxin [Pseudomonadota bacterium]|nr:type II toxin-antitoxin system VapC family toxin [Pseudomonadota bacterium]